MIISKDFRFEAAHQLPNEEIYGACRCLHGHSYFMKVEVEGQTNSKGWVMNFKTLKTIVNSLFIDKYDHWFLNDYFTISTAEYMAQYIYNTLQEHFETEVSRKLYGIVKVNEITLYETESSCAVCKEYMDIPPGIVKDHSKVIKDIDRIQITIKE